ncbi:MFS transporter [Deinococcus radiodurans]|nr:MFS transporter [Deinococcus radiodurans]ANC71763.1 MFS transporter [Deinococcus radiodurans R1 = ATCC 13939 = DSM 20539]QIP29146.1 MFS transporter [Deinococcus radiodurans]QIP32157.1 MFS transporter [Deinococcus radiodurans]UID70047.1 MFS transporter [Deinococcus radiodurans R1 = ATCC 13939 = DSM 20539]
MTLPPAARPAAALPHSPLPSPPLPSPWVLSAFWFGTAFLWLMLLTIYMPAHVVGFMGAAHKGTYLGLLGAIGAAIALVVPPLVGAHSDKTGRRLPYLRLGVGINVAGLAVMGAAVGLLAGSTGFWVYVLGFVLVQFGNNYATAPYSALIPQLVPPEQRGRYSGAMGTLQALGQLLGAAAGVAIGSHYGASLPFVLMAALLLVAAVITIRGVVEQAEAVAPAAPGEVLPWRELFAYAPFKWVFITRVLFALGQYSVQPFLQFYAGDVLRQKDPVMSSSLLLACIVIASIISAVVGGRLSDRIGRKPVIYFAGTVMTVTALLLLVAPSFTFALLLAFCFGLGFGAFTSVDWALGADAMPSRSSYARDMGIWHVAFVAPQFVNLPMGALLDWGNRHGDNFGYVLVFGSAALFFLLGVVLVRNVPEVRKAG